ncbi:MAG: tRNA 2-selenouridine(34) synthase MnmH [Pseudomonadales bacterium]|jgi:tRNA 2-selenouridine synthase|nr:tRNA 2-selenouridine(34) synthase MnmH [Pseudomonadales bacterium]
MRSVASSEFDALLLAHTPLLDLRAPVEFARGSIPRATSLPLLTDDERARIGTCYKRQGPEAARALGHEIVSGAVREARLRAWCAWCDAHPEGVLYCFRGGQRSHVVQDWLAGTGRHVALVEGGYKALRTHLLGRLEQLAGQARLAVVGGRTGTAKTGIIERLSRSIDLEGLARHRGSAFGRRVGGQPTPVDFENRLALRLLELRAADDAPIAIEDESRNVGRLSVPAELVANMSAAPIALVEMPLEFRVDVTLDAYVVGACSEHQAAAGEEAGFESFAAQLRDGLGRIRRRLGGARHDEIAALLEHALARHRDAGELDAHRGWIERLLVEYYDPMYDYQLEGKQDRVVFRGAVADVEAWLRDRTASEPAS